MQMASDTVPSGRSEVWGVRRGAPSPSVLPPVPLPGWEGWCTTQSSGSASSNEMELIHSFTHSFNLLCAQESLIKTSWVMRNQ